MDHGRGERRVRSTWCCSVRVNVRKLCGGARESDGRKKRVGVSGWGGAITSTYIMCIHIYIQQKHRIQTDNTYFQ